MKLLMKESYFWGYVPRPSQQAHAYISEYALPTVVYIMTYTPNAMTCFNSYVLWTSLLSSCPVYKILISIFGKHSLIILTHT